MKNPNPNKSTSKIIVITLVACGVGGVCWVLREHNLLPMNGSTQNSQQTQRVVENEQKQSDSQGKPQSDTAHLSRPENTERGSTPSSSLSKETAVPTSVNTASQPSSVQMGTAPVVVGPSVGGGQAGGSPLSQKPQAASTGSHSKAGDASVSQPSVSQVGGTQANVPSVSQADLQKTLQKIEPAPKATGCITVTYQAKAANVKQGPQRFTKNKFKLPDDARGAHGVCVRVDGTPVKYSVSGAKKDEFIIGFVPKSNSVISLRYCHSNVTCSESCVIPRDEFMEALAGDDGDEKEGEQVAQWDSKSQVGSREEAAVDRELEALDDALNDDRKPGVFSAWVVERQIPACEGRTQPKAIVAARKTASAK